MDKEASLAQLALLSTTSITREKATKMCDSHQVLCYTPRNGNREEIRGQVMSVHGQRQVDPPKPPRGHYIRGRFAP